LRPFFWKNGGFIEHARDIGLSDMPELGVVREHHQRCAWTS